MVKSQQRHEMEALVGKVCSGIGARSLLEGSVEGVDPNTIVSNWDWWIARDSICDHVHDQGSWVRDMFEGLDDPANSEVVHEIGLFALILIVEGSVVQVERDGNNKPLDTEAPPVMPADICKLPTRTFVKDVLDRSAATSRSIGRKRILTQSRKTTRSWTMLPRMPMRSR
jgi:hypothetical protein